MIRFIVAALITLALPALAQERQIPLSREQAQLSFAPVVKQAAPAVVNIYTKRRVVEAVSPLFNDPFFNQFFGQQNGFGMPRERVVSSLGSGVIVRADGTLVTNYHVIKDAEDITAVLADKRELAADIVATDPQSDLALLKIKSDEALPFLELDDSDALQVGDLVLAVGNPFGVGQTVTSGIISALARSAASVNDYSFFIQTDAAINPGNSGGALVDMDGRLIGIPTAIYSRSGGSNGIGFAIPSNMVRALLAGIQKDGRVVKPWLGASNQELTGDIAQSLGIKNISGVLVRDVYPDSPAEQAGLKSGDVITAINGVAIDTIAALRFRVAVSEVGSNAHVTYLRSGKSYDTQAKLVAPPDRPARDMRQLNGAHPFNGASVATLNPALASELGLDPLAQGVVVITGGGAVKAGDRILALNNQKITSSAQLEKLLAIRIGSWRIPLERGGRVLNIGIVQ